MQIIDVNYNANIQTKPASSNFIGNLFTGTKKNTVVPLGGRKRNKKKKTVKKRRRRTNRKRR
jgi:hypothetical protein